MLFTVADKDPSSPASLPSSALFFFVFFHSFAFGAAPSPAAESTDRLHMERHDFSAMFSAHISFCLMSCRGLLEVA